MKITIAPIALLIALLTAAPSFADSVPGVGITREHMREMMAARGWPATIKTDEYGATIIESSVNNVTFDVYFYECANDYCRDIQFAAGWSNVTVTPDQINNWITQKRFVRVYWKPGNVVWAEMDARISEGTTENIEEYLSLWPVMLGEFKTFMNL